MITDETIAIVVERITPQLVDLRRTLHEHPELAFEEHETGRAIASYLSELRIPFRTGVGKTGIVATLAGAKPGRSIGIRADIDALPIEEQSGVAFASKRAGRMHACGHDAHTTIALGVAHVLSSLNEQLGGTVKLIFQPAEETLSGAAAMIADGVLEDPRMDALVGFHNWPPLDTGVIGYHAGAVMASSDAFDIVLEGRAGHAAHPHLGVDALVGAAQVITALQTVVSREIAPVIPAVLTVGQIEGGVARNVIAGRVVLRGTARTLDAAAAAQVEASVRRLVENIASALRLEAEVVWRKQTPVLRNDPQLLERVLGSVRQAIDPVNVRELGPASMGSEDFAWFGEHVPIVHLKIGSKIEGLDTAIHRSDYDCNEAAIPLAVRALTRVVLDLAQPAAS